MLVALMGHRHPLDQLLSSPPQHRQQLLLRLHRHPLDHLLSSPPQHRQQSLLRPQAPEVSAAVGITKTVGVVSGAVRTSEIVQELAVDFGWRRRAFPQIVLQFGVRALLT